MKTIQQMIKNSLLFFFIIIIGTYCKKSNSTSEAGITISYLRKDTLSRTRETALGVAVYRNKIFFTGGYFVGGEYRVDIYNDATGKWDTTSLTEALYATAAVALNDKIFVTGGFKGFTGPVVPSKIVNIFNAQTNVRLALTDSLSVARGNICTAATSNKVFVAGGDDNAGNTFNTVDIFDSTGKRLPAVDPLSVNRTMACAASANNKVFVFGGNGSMTFNTVDIFDSTGKRLPAVDPLSIPRANACAVVVNNKIFVAGGDDNAGNTFNTVDIFDAQTGKRVQTVTFLEKKHSLAGVSFGHYAIFIGGFTSPTTVSNTIEVFDALTYKRVYTGTINEARCCLSAGILGNKLLVAGGYNGSGDSKNVEVFSIK